MEQRLMAFWRYDLYPYFLWGEVIQIRDSGSAFIKEYGGYFYPKFILPYEKGLELAKRLQKLDRAYIVEQNSIRLKYNEYLDKLLESYGKTRL